MSSAPKALFRQQRSSRGDPFEQRLWPWLSHLSECRQHHHAVGRFDHDRESDVRRQLEVVFAAHHEAVSRYVRRRTRPELVDDAVAETFLVACRRPDAIPRDPLPWLLGVARRVLATQRRSTRRRLALTTKLAEVIGPSTVPASEQGSEEYAVRTALARLSDADREAITLIAWDDLSPAQAAIALGLSDTAFRGRLARARKRLRKQLERRPAQPAIGDNPLTPQKEATL